MSHQPSWGMLLFLPYATPNMGIRTASTISVRFKHTARVWMGFVIFADFRASCGRRNITLHILQIAYLNPSIVKSESRYANSIEATFGFWIFLTVSIIDLRCDSGYTSHPNNAIQPLIPVYRSLFLVSCKQTPQLNAIYPVYKCFKMLYDVRLWCRWSVPMTTCQPLTAT